MLIPRHRGWHCARVVRTSGPERPLALCAAVLLVLLCGSSAFGAFGKEDLDRGTTSRVARQEAVRSLPLDRLDADARRKVQSVLSHVTAYRRMPLRVIDCDPKLYLFLIQHPDVVADIWQTLGISKLQVRERSDGSYQVSDGAGTTGTAEFLHKSHDLQIVYAEGTYNGNLMKRPVKGRVVMILRSGYVLETDGRHYITSRLDAFVSIERGGVELLTKALHPLLGGTADMNFVQSINFVSSLSRTAEVNNAGVRRLVRSLKHVRVDDRKTLEAVVAGIGERASDAPRTAAKPTGPVRTPIRTTVARPITGTRVAPPTLTKPLPQRVAPQSHGAGHATTY